MSAATAEATVIEPNSGPQEAFLATEADIAIYGGAAGGGKTWGLLMEPLRHIGVPGFGAVIFRRTSPQVTQEGGMWDESQEMYPHLDAQPRLNRLQWVFPANSRIRFGHMQYEADKYDWKGAQICLVEFDQLEEFTEGQFFYLLSRNRSTCGVRPYVRASANPVPDDDPIGGWLAEFISWWIDQETGYPIPERSGVGRHGFARYRSDHVFVDKAAALLAIAGGRKLIVGRQLEVGADLRRVVRSQMRLLRCLGHESMSYVRVYELRKRVRRHPNVGKCFYRRCGAAPPFLSLFVSLSGAISCGIQVIDTCKLPAPTPVGMGVWRRITGFMRNGSEPDLSPPE